MKLVALTLTVAIGLLLGASALAWAETEEQIIAKATMAAEKARDAMARSKITASEARSASEKARNLPSSKRETLEFPQGRYVGETRDNTANGYGIWHLSGQWKGDRYEGKFWKGNYIGNGVYHKANGNRYEGETRDGEIKGVGVFYLSTGQWIGDRYEGEIGNGEYKGYGVYHFLAKNESKGIRYEGEFHDDAANGYGIQYMPNGDATYAYWENWLHDPKRYVIRLNIEATEATESSEVKYCKRTDGSVYQQPSHLNCESGSKKIDDNILSMAMVVDDPSGVRAEIRGSIRYEGDFGKKSSTWIYNEKGREICSGIYNLDSISKKGDFHISCFDDQRKASGQLKVVDPFTLRMIIAGKGSFDDGSEFQFVSGLRSQLFERRRAELIE
jgi:hypothetical protein